MYLIIVGAEAEGRRFIGMAVEQSHEVTVIEEDEEKARQVLKENDVRVLRGDIGDDKILQEAEVDRADGIVATTHDDSKNLMAMVLAKEYGVKLRISLVNQASHVQMFKALEVEVVSDPASIVAHQLYKALDQPDDVSN
ncbi:MAG: potassium channel family protein [Elainellaceae cyanobacterium]